MPLTSLGGAKPRKCYQKNQKKESLARKEIQEKRFHHRVTARLSRRESAKKNSPQRHRDHREENTQKLLWRKQLRKIFAGCEGSKALVVQRTQRKTKKTSKAENSFQLLYLAFCLSL